MSEATAERLTAAQAAVKLGVKPVTIRMWARNGLRVGDRLIRLPCHPAGSVGYRFTPADLDAFSEEVRAARNMPTTIGPRPETDAEFARRAAADVEAYNRGR